MNESLSDRVAKNLKDIRISKGKTRYQVSKEAGLSYSFVSGIESKTKIPSFNTLDKLSKYYDIDPSMFFVSTNDSKDV